MRPESGLQSVDVVILCGGLGTRLRSVASDTPKVLMPFGERTFLDILMDEFRTAGFSRFILSVGYLKEQIISRYKDVPHMVFVEENSPLGTGGAVKSAAPFMESENVLVANGDSVFKGLDIGAFYEFHVQHKAPISIALATPRTEKDFGVVTVAEDGTILNFSEKTEPGTKGLMNGGVYVMQKSVLGSMPVSPFSLEHDFFPRFAGKSLYGFYSAGEVIDIGTPERYEYAKTALV